MDGGTADLVELRLVVLCETTLYSLIADCGNGLPRSSPDRLCRLQHVVLLADPVDIDVDPCGRLRAAL